MDPGVNGGSGRGVCTYLVLPMASFDPPMCSDKVTRRFLIMAAVVYSCVSGVFVMLMLYQPPCCSRRPWRPAGMIESFINGITSMWIPGPAILALLTPKHLLTSLGPKQYHLRQLAICLSFPSMFASLLAWFHWNAVTGALDFIFSQSYFAACVALGIWKGGWVAQCTEVLVLILGVLIIAKMFLLWYSPWPHAVFRWTAGCITAASLNGGDFFATPLQLLQLALGQFFLSTIHIAMEIHYCGCQRNSWCHSLMHTSSYSRGMARCAAVESLYAIIVLFVNRARLVGKAQCKEMDFLSVDKELQPMTSDSSSSSSESS